MARKKDGLIMQPTAARAIAEIQLNMLLENAKIRPLSLEEVKIYDMLVKNLNIANGDATNSLEVQYKVMEEEMKSIPTAVLVNRVIEDNSSDSGNSES